MGREAQRQRYRSYYPLLPSILKALVGILLIERETKVLRLGSLGFLHQPVGPSPKIRK